MLHNYKFSLCHSQTCPSFRYRFMYSNHAGLIVYHVFLLHHQPMCYTVLVLKPISLPIKILRATWLFISLLLAMLCILWCSLINWIDSILRPLPPQKREIAFFQLFLLYNSYIFHFLLNIVPHPTSPLNLLSNLPCLALFWEIVFGFIVVFLRDIWVFFTRKSRKSSCNNGYFLEKSQNFKKKNFLSLHKYNDIPYHLRNDIFYRLKASYHEKTFCLLLWKIFECWFFHLLKKKSTFNPSQSIFKLQYLRT